MIENYLIEHPNLLGKLYAASKRLKLGFVTGRFDKILEKQRKKGLTLAKNVSGRTLKKGTLVTYD